MKLLIGIPTIRFYQPFWKSMQEFIPEVARKYQLEVIEVKNRKIVEARTAIVDYFMSKDHDYLLFLDDDHEGHTLEMLEALIRANASVCCMKSHMKFFPYATTLFDYSGRTEPDEKYICKNNKSGYDQCDLVGFGMTLIKRSVFHAIDKPYFVDDHNRREDNYFCEKLLANDIKPIGCFDYTLSHFGIDGDKAMTLRSDGMKEIIKEAVERDPSFDPNNMVVVV